MAEADILTAHQTYFAHARVTVDVHNRLLRTSLVKYNGIGEPTKMTAVELYNGGAR